MKARYSVGQKVRISNRACEQHNRTPMYARGKVGVVERICEAYGQPETLAYGEDGKPDQVLYRVRLNQAELWPDVPGEGFARTDTLEIEIFEHWLEECSQ